MAGKNGGARAGAGRKPKATELELIDRLSPLDDSALEALKLGVQSGDFNFIKLFMAYRFGQPKQEVDAKISGKINIINLGTGQFPDETTS